MRKRILVLCGLAAFLAWSQGAYGDERKLTGPEIATVLTGKNTESVGSDNKTTQNYYKSGETINTANGQPSQGNWEVRGNQYCSQWPPNEAWVCYDFVQNGDEFAFVSSSGKRYAIRVTGDIAH